MNSDLDLNLELDLDLDLEILYIRERSFVEKKNFDFLDIKI